MKVANREFNKNVYVLLHILKQRLTAVTLYLSTKKILSNKKKKKNR